MKVKNTSESALQEALVVVNKKYDNNITFKRFECLNTKQTRFLFTLTVKNSRNPGGRIGFTGRRVCAACWHAHGDFFDALLKITPGAEIRSSSLIINKDGGNWQDRNIGSVMCPMYYSEACDC